MTGKCNNYQENLGICREPHSNLKKKQKSKAVFYYNSNIDVGENGVWKIIKVKKTTLWKEFYKCVMLCGNIKKK